MVEYASRNTVRLTWTTVVIQNGPKERESIEYHEEKREPFTSWTIKDRRKRGR
jgi:hypothetical protein